MNDLPNSLANSLSAYVDGELDAAETRRIEALIAADPALAARVQELRETAALLRAACAETFYSDPMAHLLLPSSRPHWYERARLMAAVAACLLAAVLGFAAAQLRPDHGGARTAILSEIAEYHEVFSRETTRLVELGPDRAEELYAWLGERVGRQLRAPDLSSVGLAFAGGRMLVVVGRPVAELMYTRNYGLPVALCVLAVSEKPASVHVEERGRLRLAWWSDGRHMFVVIGEFGAAKAKRIADLVAAQIDG